MASSMILPDGGVPGAGLEVRPAGFPGHPEDIDGPVLVRVLRIGSLVLLGHEPGLLRTLSR